MPPPSTPPKQNTASGRSGVVRTQPWAYRPVPIVPVGFQTLSFTSYSSAEASTFKLESRPPATSTISTDGRYTAVCR